MTVERATCEAVFRDAVAACDPSRRVRDALARSPVHARGTVLGLAIGKAALAMARGAGPVARGLVITVADDGCGVPPGWQVAVGSHPVPDAASLATGAAALALVEGAAPDDVVLALISGGASALAELPAPGVTLAELVARVAALAASGAPIRAINAERARLSALKGGKLAARCAAPVITLVASDVIGDDPAVIGSGPTVAARPGDRVEVVAPIASFGEAVAASLAARGLAPRRLVAPLDDDVAAVADRLAGEAGLVVAWGEPTVRVPDDAGRGGRAQQLALELARRLRGLPRSALVAGSDGRDGPGPDAPAGAFVDGASWDAIAAAGLDPLVALRRCDAGTALGAIGALLVTGPTGINHADVVIVG